MTFGTSAGGIGFGVALQLYDFFTGPAYRIQRSMQSLNLATTDFAKSMNRQMNAVKATFAAFAGSAGVVAMAAVPAMMAAKYDAMKAQFEVMLGSAKQAENTLIQLRNFAKTTPFGMEETISSAKRLLAFGIPLKDLMSDMRMLGDVATAVGKENLDPIILAYGQARVKGFLMGDELRQFAERSVPFMDYIKKYFKENEGVVLDGIAAFDKIKGRKVTFQMMRDMLKQMTSEGGRFANMMERMEGRPLQLLDRIGGEFYELGLKFGEAVMTSGAPMLKVIAGLAETLNDMAPTAIGEIAVQIALLGGSLASLATASYLLAKAPSLGRWLAGTYTEAMGYKGLSHYLFNPESREGQVYSRFVARAAHRGSAAQKGALRGKMSGFATKLSDFFRMEPATTMDVESIKLARKHHQATLPMLLNRLASGQGSYDDFPTRLGPFEKDMYGGWIARTGAIRNAKNHIIGREGKRTLVGGKELDYLQKVSHDTVMQLLNNRLGYQEGRATKLFRPDASQVYGDILGYKQKQVQGTDRGPRYRDPTTGRFMKGAQSPIATGTIFQKETLKFYSTFERRKLVQYGTDWQQLGRTIKRVSRDMAGGIASNLAIFGKALTAPYTAAALLGKQVEKLGNIFAPFIGKMLIVGTMLGILVAGYLQFQAVLKGTAAPAEGLAGTLQRIGGALSGVYELTMAWNGEVALMQLKTAQALSRLGILETVAKMSVFFIRLKEVLGGAMHGFMVVFRIVGSALSYVVWGIAKVMGGLAKLLGYTSAVAIDVRIWRAFGAVIGVYLAGAALRAAWSFGVMAYTALKAAIVTNLGFAPILFTVLAISAAVVGLLALFGQMADYDMEEPFSRFQTGIDQASKSGSADYFVQRDFIPSMETKRRINEAQIQKEEERVRAYYANEKPQEIKVMLDKKVLASVLKDAQRVEDSR